MMRPLRPGEFRSMKTGEIFVEWAGAWCWEGGLRDKLEGRVQSAEERVGG